MFGFRLPTAPATASSELNPPHDEPLDPPAAHQEVTRKVRDSSISAPTSVKFLRSRITDGEASRNLGTYTDRETLSTGLLTWEPPVRYMYQTPCTGRIQVDVWISDCRSITMRHSLLHEGCRWTWSREVFLLPVSGDSPTQPRVSSYRSDTVYLGSRPGLCWGHLSPGRGCSS